MIRRFVLELNTTFFACMIAVICSLTPPVVIANEVIENTQTRVIVREHPKTGKPFVSIVRSDVNNDTTFFGKFSIVSRPDYRMLDPKVKAKDVPYDGPVSDRRKVYILAGTLAALGAAGGVIGTLAPAVATSSGGAAGGAGLYAGGAALTGGGTIVGSLAAQSDNQPEDFEMKAESKENHK